MNFQELDDAQDELERLNEGKEASEDEEDKPKKGKTGKKNKKDKKVTFLEAISIKINGPQHLSICHQRAVHKRKIS